MKQWKKQQKNLIESIKIGAEIITYSGVIGIVKSIDLEKERLFIQSGSSKLVISSEAVYKVIKEG